VIRVYDEAGNMIETHEHAGDFEEQWRVLNDAQRHNRVYFPRCVAGKILSPVLRLLPTHIAATVSASLCGRRIRFLRARMY
jgi:hypothetical protein